jgi:hypothetical protein
VSEHLAERVRRWLLPFWATYMLAWAIIWGVRFAAAGGFESSSHVIYMVMSGVTGLFGLITGWLARRECRTVP